ncbi:hypothetical protein Aperf_G00000096878 [Anoplocephala perfoliata]
MGDIEGIKAYIYSYLHKNFHKLPEYSFKQRATGRGRLRFICELRVDGFPYIGMGNSANKKGAQTNAARDFANFLVREGYLKQSDLPAITSEDYEHNQDAVLEPSIIQSSSDFHPQSQSSERTDDSYINRIMDKVKLEEAEQVDFTADIHGGWSMENSKARLNEYLQVARLPPIEIKYTSVGPDHNKSFVAEANLYAKGARKNLYARESGSNKVLASRACCLSLVRQLFHIGEIEAFSGERKKKRIEEVAPIPVELDSELENRLHSLLERLNLVPVLTPPPQPVQRGSGNRGNELATEEHNMIINYNVADFVPRPRQSAQLVSWCLPTPNWNPWTACNIDEGPEALQSLPQISQRYKHQYEERINSRDWSMIIAERNALPVANYREEIIETIERNQVTLIKGETGCGKTTQVPQFILDSYLASGHGAECAILVTQPRRICAISLAERVASERCEPLGISVGYSVRFETVLPRPFGSVLFCTIGTLCRKMEAGIRGVSHIIVDEIHERDVNTDFMMILIRDLVRANPKLRVILMSATIDTTTFYEYFGNTATVELHGRTFSVQSYFLEDCIQMTNFVPRVVDGEKRSAKRARQEEAANSEQDEDNCNLICSSSYPPSVAESMRLIPEKEVPFELIGCLLEHICNMGVDGAVLIFLPGWNTISFLKKYLESHPRFQNPREFLILSMHSQVPREDQRLVFRPAPPGVRKIVLSTNISESSITINDVVFVIDSCLARVKMFTARNNLTSYSTVWASTTNLEQRRGRAGRVRPGFAYHLCSRERFSRLETHITPEILRTPLHELALMIKLLRLGDIQQFLRKAIISPPLDAIVEAEHTLREMKALDSNDELTPLGLILARLPMEPRLGRMLVFSCAFDLGGAMSVIAAQASFDCEVLAMPPNRRRLSFNQIRFAADTHSDHLAMLNAFQLWASVRARNGEESAASFCEDKELNSFSLRMIDDAASQIRNILLNLQFPGSVLFTRPIDFHDPASPKFDFIAAMLTNGLYPNIAYHADARKLLTAEGKFALIHKASVNCIKETKFIFPFFTFTEKIRTQAISCKTLTMISPIHLLLFGCRRGVWQFKPQGPGVHRANDEGIVLIDDWLPLRMRYSTVARIFALRPALDALLVRICMQPSCLEALSHSDSRLIELTKALCRRNAIPGVADQVSQNDDSYFGGDNYPDIYRSAYSELSRRCELPPSLELTRRPPEMANEGEICVRVDNRNQSFRGSNRSESFRSGDYSEMPARIEAADASYHCQWSGPSYTGSPVLPPPPLSPPPAIGVKREYPRPEEEKSHEFQPRWDQRNFYANLPPPPQLLPPPLRSYYSEPSANIQPRFPQNRLPHPGSSGPSYWRHPRSSYRH